MDIWAWVTETIDELMANGEHRLAELVTLYPSYVVDHEHEKIEALFPEALAAARAKKSPWLEVYFRHWRLQSRVLKRCEVKESLPEAVDLLDFASREETQSCPQSVCVVQDLANCYGKADGPGYARERIDVAEETLGRIDASWPCFMCISSELASALYDDGRPDEALELAREAEVKTNSTDGSQMRGVAVSSLIQLGRTEEALEYNERSNMAEGGEAFVLSKTIDHARILAKLGRHEEAKEALPAPGDIDGLRDEYDRYTDALTELAIAGAVENVWRIGMFYRHLHTDLEDNGAVRSAFVVAQRRAHLALARRAYGTVEDTLVDLRRIASKLHVALDAPERIGIIEDLLAERRKAAPAVDPEALTERLEALGEDPEEDVETLRFLAAHEPLDATRQTRLGDALGALGHAERALAAYEAAAEAAPDDADVLLTLADAYGRRGDGAAIDALVARVRDAQSEHLAPLLTMAAQYAATREDFDGARAALAEAASLADDPAVTSAAAWVERRAGDWAASLAYLDRLVEAGHADADVHWDRALAATILERWDVVRDAAVALEHPVEAGDTPIDEEWGGCRVVFREGDGRTTRAFALRTGPVTARVLELASPGEPQHKGDEVVFDPAPVHLPEEDEDAPTEYAVVKVRSAGGFTSYHLDGARPSEDAIEVFGEALAALGGSMWVKSGDEYAISDDDGETSRPAWYVVIGFPASVSPEQAAAWLDAAQLPEPTVWLELASAVGDDEELARQAEIAEQWGL